MRISSTAFADGGFIPARHSCDGLDTSPPLAITEVPDGSVTLALVMDDPDAAGGTWDHWVAYDIPVQGSIAEGAAGLGTAGRNSWGGIGYRGPCCPKGQTHRYITRLLALDVRLGLGPGASKAEFLRAASGHIVSEATLTGHFRR